MKLFKLTYILMGDENTYETIIQAETWYEARMILIKRLGLRTVSDLAYLYDKEV